MIDTDNDELDNLNDFSLDNKQAINLERLSEIDDDVNEKSFNKTNYSFNEIKNSNPPSFKSAMTRSPRSQYHQYQNI